MYAIYRVSHYDWETAISWKLHTVGLHVTFITYALLLLSWLHFPCVVNDFVCLLLLHKSYLIDKRGITKETNASSFYNAPSWMHQASRRTCEWLRPIIIINFMHTAERHYSFLVTGCSFRLFRAFIELELTAVYCGVAASFPCCHRIPSSY